MSSKLATYIEDIARKRAAIMADFVEVPASPPHGNDEPDEDRIAQVKKKVQEIYGITNGNPADGQWAMMSRVLRLGVTSGKHQHWIGTREDLKAPEEHKEVPWINAKSEQEWSQWEKRASTVDKVKTWSRRVEESTSFVEPLSATSSQLPPTQELPPKAKVSVVSTPVDPLDAPTPLGFSVVKRPTKSSVKGKPAASQRSARKGSMGPPPSSSFKPTSKSNKNIPLPEPSLPAPSFSDSQIITSTPKPKPGSTKPTSRQSNPLQEPFLHATPPIERPLTPPPPTASASSPKPTPLNNQRQPSAIPLPQTPPRRKQTPPTSNVFNANNKRTLEVEEVRAQKKARTMSPAQPVAPIRPKTPEAQAAAQPSAAQQAEPSPSPRFVACADNPLFSNTVEDAPTTPTKQSKALPTLTELLASSRKSKDGRKSTRLTPNVMPEMRSKPSSKGKEKEIISADPSFDHSAGYTSKDQGTDPQIPDAQVLDSLPLPPAIDEDNPYMLDTDALHPSSDEIDILLTSKAAELSPTKSLSSIADSDEEDEDDDPRSPPPDSSPIVGTFSFNPSGFSFNPQATSTQNMYAPFAPLNQSPGGSGEHSFNFLSNSSPFRSSQVSSGPKAGPSSRYAYAQYRPAGASNRPNESQNEKELPANSMDSWASVYKHRAFQYTSQLQSNIAKQVDQVDKLLEKDVDYEGWLKDPSAEPEEAEVEPDSSP